MKPPRAHSVRVRLYSGANFFAPILGGYPGSADPALFGVFIDYDKKVVEFYDPYPESIRVRKAREAYVCDIAELAEVDDGGGSITPRPIVFSAVSYMNIM